MTEKGSAGGKMQVDARGKMCPQPVVMAINALREMKDGEIAEVLVSDMTAVENLKRMAAGKNYPAKVQENDGFWTVCVQKLEQEGEALQQGDGLENIACPTGDAALPKKKNEVIIIATDEFGQGTQELGRILMKNYLYALAQQDILPQILIFLNRGAFLTSEGSESLADLHDLEKRGVEIFTCGVCADFYGVKEKISVGRISNMYDISRMMQEADKVVRI